MGKTTYKRNIFRLAYTSNSSLRKFSKSILSFAFLALKSVIHDFTSFDLQISLVSDTLVRCQGTPKYTCTYKVSLHLALGFFFSKPVFIFGYHPSSSQSNLRVCQACIYCSHIGPVVYHEFKEMHQFNYVINKQ